MQWSWGSSNDENVFLKVWEHELKQNQSKALVLRKSSPVSHGRREQLKHLMQVIGGKDGYCVVIAAKDTGLGSVRVVNYSEAVFKILGFETELSTGDLYAVINPNESIHFTEPTEQ